MSNDAAFVSFDRWIAKIHKSHELAVEAAPEIADALHVVVSESAAAQTSPDGQRWKPAQSGKPMFVGASKAITTVAAGTTITQTVAGHYARHHGGTAKGGIARPMIPTRRTPDAAITAFERVWQRKCSEHFKG